MAFPDFIAEPLELIERYEPLPGHLSLPFEPMTEEPQMSKTATADPPKRGRGRPKKVVPSEQFGPPAPATLDKDAILREAVSFDDDTETAAEKLKALDTGSGIPSAAILDFLGDLWQGNPVDVSSRMWKAKGGARPCI